MSACSGCGAAADTNYLTCQFCGASLSEVSAGDEIKAIQEIALTAQRIATEKTSTNAGNPFNMGNMMQQMMEQTGVVEGQSVGERLALLWTNAYVPVTFEGQAQAFSLVLTNITTSGRSDHAGKHAANEANINRGESLLMQMEMHAASDPGLRPRVEVARRQLEKKQEKVSSFKSSGHKKAYVAIGVAVVMVVAMLIFVLMMVMKDNRPGKCRGEWSNCDDICRLSMCSELCDEGLGWACTAKDQLGKGSQSQEKKLEPPSIK